LNIDIAAKAIGPRADIIGAAGSAVTASADDTAVTAWTATT
jgi:hypothetical protein